MQNHRPYAPGTSRKIGGGADPLTDGRPVFRMPPARGWLLKVSAVAFTWPTLLALMRGSFTDTVALVVAMALLFTGGQLVARGAAEEAEGEGRTLKVSPLPWKLFGCIAAGIAAFLVSLGPSGDSTAMAVLFGLLAAGGCIMVYGLDPRANRAAIEAAAKRAGIKAKDVVDQLEVAYRKVDGIEAAAAALRSRELRERLDRICGRARAILGQLERDPKDLSRARRFLVTYLDGTRDVVAAYAKQQHDLAETPLAGNFRGVLDTVEQVFTEQQELLKRDEKLDLEVRIEVLETQMKREGIH